MEAPLISVIVTAYNYAHLLPRALESVLQNQDYPNIEVLVMDDASEDDTETLMRRYTADSRIRYIRQPQNLGAARNANAGLRAACGAYLSLLSADNLMYPGFLSTLYAAHAQHPEIDIAYGTNHSWRVIDGEMSVWEHLPVAYSEGVNEFAELLTAGCYISLEAALMKRECLEACGVLDETILAADLELLVRFAASGRRFRHIPEARFTTLVHDGQLSSPSRYVATGRIAFDYVEILERYLRSPFHARIRGYEHRIAHTLQALEATVTDYGFADQTRALRERVLILCERLEEIRRANAELPKDEAVNVVIFADEEAQSDGDARDKLRRSLAALSSQTHSEWKAVVLTGEAERSASLAREADDLVPGKCVVYTVPAPARERTFMVDLALKLCPAHTIGFMRSGDVFAPDHLRRTAETLTRTGFGARYTGDLDAVHGATAIIAPSTFAVRREAVDWYTACFGETVDFESPDLLARLHMARLLSADKV